MIAADMGMDDIQLAGANEIAIFISTSFPEMEVPPLRSLVSGLSRVLKKHYPSLAVVNNRLLKRVCNHMESTCYPSTPGPKQASNVAASLLNIYAQTHQGMVAERGRIQYSEKAKLMPLALLCLKYKDVVDMSCSRGGLRQANTSLTMARIMGALNGGKTSRESTTPLTALRHPRLAMVDTPMDDLDKIEAAFLDLMVIIAKIYYPNDDHACLALMAMTALDTLMAEHDHNNHDLMITILDTTEALSSEPKSNLSNLIGFNVYKEVTGGYDEFRRIE